MRAIVERRRGGEGEARERESKREKEGERERGMERETRRVGLTRT